MKERDYHVVNKIKNTLESFETEDEFIEYLVDKEVMFTVDSKKEFFKAEINWIEESRIIFLDSWSGEIRENLTGTRTWLEEPQKRELDLICSVLWETILEE